MVETHDLNFDILSDHGNEVADQFNLVHGFPDELKSLYRDLGINLPKYNGEDSWTLPLPARYIIDKDQVIQYSRVNADYKNRPEPEETLQALTKLNEG